VIRPEDLWRFCQKRLLRGLCKAIRLIHLVTRLDVAVKILVKKEMCGTTETTENLDFAFNSIRLMISVTPYISEL
jgi:hypothetical protein